MPRPRREVPWCEFFRGAYHAYWYEPDTKRTRRLSLGTADVGEANARFAEFLTHGRDVYSSARSGKTVTVDAVIELYKAKHLLAVDDAGRRIVRDERRQIDALANVLRHFSGVAVRDIGVEACRAYQDARRAGSVAGLWHRGKRAGEARPGKDSTIRRELSALQAAINVAVKWELLVSADAPKLEKPSGGPGKTLWLYEDELDVLRGCATGKAVGLIELLYWTAARRRSIERLTVFQVDLPGRLINLAPEDDVQRNKRRPIVPIDDELFPTVERLVREATASGTPYLLGSGAPAVTVFNRVAARAGVLELPARGIRPRGRLTPHVLRHTRATHLLQSGVDPYAVAGLLGDTVEMVERVYGHHCPEHIRRAIERRRIPVG